MRSKKLYSLFLSFQSSFRSAYFYTVLFWAMGLLACNGNKNGAEDLPTELKEYHISCSKSALDSIYQHFQENIYIPIHFEFKGQTVVARMRVRGDTSREDPKKSLKIKFDSTLIDVVPQILNLNAEYADKTYVRQYISSLMMQRSGQICYRTELIKLYINGRFAGLYLQVENMDDSFLERNGLSTDGNLYKATKDGACLSIYDEFELDWEKKTNKKSDHNDLNRLINDINNIPDSEFEYFLKSTFHYNELVDLLALNMMLSNASTYYHNYYLYHDLYEDGKWRIFPWDMDKTMSYYNWMPYSYHRTSSEWESDNALVERAILCLPVFNDIQTRITEIHAEHMNDLKVGPIIDRLSTLLESTIPLDSTDNISSVKEWRSILLSERKYFDEHFVRLQEQFHNAPRSFKVFNSMQVQTGPSTFQWKRSSHPANKPISYILTYGTDPLLLDSTTTKKITDLSDTSFTFDPALPEGTYYWKVTAFDGTYHVDGFNTKNILTVKKGTPLPSIISGSLTLAQENSPYVAEQKTIIEEGADLRISKGVEVHLPQNATIECSGNFIAEGTFDEPVVFMPRNDAKNWGFIYFYRRCEKAILNNVILKEGVINCKSKTLVLDSCSIFIDQKDIGQVSGERVDLIYADHSNISITNSTFISNGYGEGMVFFNSEPTTENCYFDQVPDAIEYISCNKGFIRSNYVTNSTDDAIDLNDCNNILIKGNILIGNKDKAISIGTEQYGPSQEGILIEGNLMVGNNFGVAIKDSSVATIRNNTIVNNTYGINAYRKRDDYGQGGNGIVTNTILHDNEKISAYADEFSKLTLDYSLVPDKLLAKNNVKGDPDFINAPRNIFHLRTTSPGIGKGEGGADIGAFGHNEMVVAMAEIHVRSSEEGKCGDYIRIIGHYNMPVDLSLYTLTIDRSDEQKQFVFPIGTMLDRFGEIYICRNYSKCINCRNRPNVIGGLPKLKAVPTTITLLDPSGYELDHFSYTVNENDPASITFISNEVNDMENRIWRLVPE